MSLLCIPPAGRNPVAVIHLLEICLMWTHMSRNNLNLVSKKKGRFKFYSITSCVTFRWYYNIIVSQSIIGRATHFSFLSCVSISTEKSYCWSMWCTRKKKDLILHSIRRRLTESNRFCREEEEDLLDVNQPFNPIVVCHYINCYTFKFEIYISVTRESHPLQWKGVSDVSPIVGHWSSNIHSVRDFWHTLHDRSLFR